MISNRDNSLHSEQTLSLLAEMCLFVTTALSNEIVRKIPGNLVFPRRQLVICVLNNLRMCSGGCGGGRQEASANRS